MKNQPIPTNAEPTRKPSLKTRYRLGRRRAFRFWTWRPVAVVRTIIARFLDAACPLHAAGLTYFSLLAAIPILCCVLVLAKSCSVDKYARDQINGRIDAFIVNLENGQDDGLAVLTTGNEEEREAKRQVAIDLGRQARAVSQQLFERIEAFDVSTFGWIGFGMLLWTVVSSLGMVEMSFNQIWRVPKARPIWKRVGVYLFVIVVLPVLAAVTMSLPVLNVVKQVIVATAGATSLTKWLSDGLILLLESAAFRILLTLIASSVTFGFFYWLMPNCRVSFRNAWIGGLVGAILFSAWIRLCAVAQIGIAKSSALYGSFAFLPILLAWIYMSWQIVLAGACLVHALDTHALAAPGKGDEA